MSIIKANSDSIAQAAEIIKKGGLVAFPTETVYGLGADGLNPIAVAKIFEVKKRPSFNPLILHISQKDWIKKLTIYDDERIDLLIEKFWPGPLTLVLQKTDLVPDIVTSGNPTVAIRMPNHKVALELIEKSETPIAAPSANRFGHLSPTLAEHVKKSLGDKVDLILDGGKSNIGVESTIVQFSEGNFYLLRPGGLSKEEIEKIIDTQLSLKINTTNPESPGQLPYHYSPSVPLLFLNEKNLKKNSDRKIGVLFFKEKNIDFNFASIKILSPSGDIKEAAANLFKYLHEFESENLDLILVEPIKEEGLGLAIMDRLKKASKKYD
ncbi:L-threonylcarbamoyladenylate synthase [Rosettibacter firmus]|uniref:L-threonylcarbamoyladenylate synthase n=1 Tax=Rosettibacter firmus TaxID=3111522 RepID=UPI00336C0BC1